MNNKALDGEREWVESAEPLAADRIRGLDPTAPPVDVDGVISAGVEAGWSLRKLADQLASIGRPMSHETVRSRVAKLGSALAKPPKPSIAQAKLDDDYVEAAAMAAIRPSCSASSMVKPVSFMRNNPDMLLGWRAASLSSKTIASILTAMGMPVASQTVLNVLSSLASGSDPSRVRRIANRINLLIASGVAPLAAPVSSAPHATLDHSPISSAGQFPTLEARPAPAPSASASHPLSNKPAPSPALGSPSRPHGRPSAMVPDAMRAGAVPTSAPLVMHAVASKSPSPSTAPSPASSDRLLDLDGELQDFDSSLWDEPVSYRDVREALWTQVQLGAKRAYSIAPGGRELMDIGARVAAKAIDGSLPTWKEFLREFNK
jgi:hypothetical protein